jgi:sporulation protein YlmC with PRC-barrel domain
MDTGRYLPAERVHAGSLQLSDLSVRAHDGRELGKLAGFVIDPGAHCIRSLVLQSDAAQVEVPMGHIQIDSQGRTLRLVDASTDGLKTFAADAMPVVEDADLWVPVFHSAA